MKNEAEGVVSKSPSEPEPAAERFRVCILQHAGNGPAPGKVIHLDRRGTLNKEVVGWRERFLVADFHLNLADLHAMLSKPLGYEFHLTGGTCGHAADPEKAAGAVAVTAAALARAAGSSDLLAPLTDSALGLPLMGFGDHHLRFRPGPGLMVIDTDRIAKMETPVSAQLKTAVAGIEEYARVEAPSSGSFIYDKSGKERSGLTGLHTFYGVMDATDIPRTLEVMHRRLVLSGFAKFWVGDTGVIHERSAVDLAMKKSSQPVYAGAAKMKDGLVSKRAANTVYRDGKPLMDTRALVRDLSPEEEREYAAKVAEARAPLLAEAAEKKALYIERQAQDRVRKSDGKLTLEEARAAVKRSIDGGFLSPEHEVLMADGTIVTVADIVANPKVFYLRHCRDPHEWSYGSETVAQVRRDCGELCIVSFAHGKHTMRLGERASAREDFEPYPLSKEAERVMAEAVAVAIAASVPAWVCDMNARYAFIAGEGATSNFCLLEFFSDGSWKQIEHRLAEKTHANDMVDLGGKNGAPDFKNRFAAWMKHPGRRTYQRGIAFLPGKPREWEGFFNTWAGWALEARAGSWSNIEAHIRDILCDGDTDVFDYLMGWLAWRVQNPGGAMGVVPVFRGEQGNGKSMFADWLSQIFGDACLVTAHSDDIVGKFNIALADRNLVICEEAFFAGDPSFRGKLKAIITEKVLRVEGKFLPSRQIRNHLGMIWLTNETHSAPAEVGDRRFFVVECAPKREQAYYTKLVAAAEVELHAFFHHLRTRDLKGFSVQAFPKTSARADQIGKNLTGLNRFGIEMLDRGQFPKGCGGDFMGDIFEDWDTQPIFIPKETLRDAITDFMRSHERGRRANEREVKALVEALGGQDYRPAGEKRVWRLPPRAQAWETFEEKMGMSPKRAR